MRRMIAVLALVAALAARAHAGTTVSVGLFAPAAPFAGTEARLEFVSRLAEQLARALGLDAGVGRVYAKASDFAAAVKKGEIQLAVVDATYLAHTGATYPVIAALQRDGQTAAPWEIVASGGVRGVLALEGKTLIVPSLGGHEEDFVMNVGLEGELQRGFFGKVTTATDAAAAVAAVGLGKADAACVPAGLTLPAGVTRVVALPSVSWPLLVALPGTDAAQAAKVGGALAGFAGGEPFSGFRAAGGDVVKTLARRFTRAVKRGPLVVPALRLALGALLEGRKLTIARPSAAGYAELPPK